MTEVPEIEDGNYRVAVRGLLLDPTDRVLLCKLDLERNGWTGWVLPGGGVELGEEHTDALRRELREETGLTEPFVGPVVCRRIQRGSGIAPGFDGQQELIYLVPCRHFEPSPEMPEAELRAEGQVDVRWFTLDDLRSMTETIVPGRLLALVEQVLEHGGSVDPMIIDVTEK